MIIHDLYQDNSFFDEMNVSDSLFIDGVDDSFFYHLNKNNGLRKLEKLRFSYHGENLTNKSYELFKNIKSLRKLNIHGKNVSKRLLKEVKIAHPLCEILLNNKEITL